VRVLIAPDKFKDAIDAPMAAAAMRDGVLDARPDAEVDVCPLGDGGEGTGQLLAATLQLEERCTTVLDPLGRKRTARWWWRGDDAHAVIEMAEASGLSLLTQAERDPLRTSSFGTGELLRAAIEIGASKITLCVGGSATVDGGAGCLQALGWRFFDEDEGRIFEPITGLSVSDVRKIAPPAWMPEIQLTILADVDNPLLGRDGAAPAFAPQKGADAAAVARLSANLKHWAHLLAQTRGVLVHAMRGGGAAGGLPAGLHACLGARCEPGFDAVAREVDLRSRMRAAALCLTGEGRLDAQTARGKIVAGVGRMAREVDTPAMAFVGAFGGPDRSPEDTARTLGLRDIVVVTPLGTALPEALAATAANLRAAVAQHLSLRR
jgi:glycerate kinase